MKKGMGGLLTTLFALAEPACKIFQQVLDKFFDGKMDDRTVALLRDL